MPSYKAGYETALLLVKYKYPAIRYNENMQNNNNIPK